MSFNNSLPAGMSGEFTVTLQEGRHQGESQLWAPVTHNGKTYKFVVSGQIEGLRRLSPKAGETWLVWPDRSPNGHVVFCKPYRMSKDASGVPALLAEIQDLHIGPGFAVRILKDDRGHEERCGTVADITADDEFLVISVRKATLQERSSVLPRPIPDFQFRCQIADSHLVANKHNRAPFVRTCVDRVPYDVSFRRTPD